MDEMSDGEDVVRSLKRIFSVIASDIYSHEMETHSSLNSINLMGTLT